MAKLTQTTEPITEAAVVIEPKLRQALQTKLTAYAALQAQVKAIKARMDSLVEEMGTIRDETGEMSVKLDGYGSITLVAGTYKKFNPKRYVQLGGNLAVYNEANEDRPRKAYNKVTVAGAEKDGGDDAE
jgi:D-lyxose ketol-isomerase